MSYIPETIRGETEYIAFVDYLFDRLGMAFHPDTPTGEYIEIVTGKPTFSVSDERTIDRLWEESFRNLEINRIYELAYEGYARRFFT